MARRNRRRGRPQSSKRIIHAENNRHGTDRDPVASTVSTGEHTAPLESRRQRRALRGPRQRHAAITSTVRDAWAGPVTVAKRKRATRVKPDGRRVFTNPAHRDPPGMVTTRNVGGSTPGQQYVYGTG